MALFLPKVRFSALVDAAARPYIPTGTYPWRFARGKLRHDPVFRTLLRQGFFPDSGRLLDLGCGFGVLMALLLAARAQHARGDWPAHWPAPPLNLEMRGLELRKDRAQAAQQALQDGARVDRDDIRRADLPPSDVIVILDVLLYLEDGEQCAVLTRAAQALRPGGVLLLREADAAAGLRFHVTRWSARIDAVAQDGLRQKLHFRRAAHWAALLEELGLAVRAQPMSEGTPFCNVLFVARKGGGAGAQ